MSDLLGRNLGSYRVIEQLGQGGMATVYKAYQPSMDRYVAIKILPRHFAHDPTFIGRFEQEAKVIAKLEHARILPVYDYGEDDGTTYIVMRYLEAGTLADLIGGEESVPIGQIARIVDQVAEGLDYAHGKGVIHRDIKPSNIMLDESNDVYITDFGISKLVEGTAQFTGSGIVGTPAYVSPEQGMGKLVDYRSDIYSLGVVLYQMVIGDVPFHAETPMAVVIKHIYEPLPMPRSVKPELPESIERVILKAMAKSPDERYQSCGEMAEALQNAAEMAVLEPEAAIPQIEAEDIEAGTLAMEAATEALPFHLAPTKESTPTEHLKPAPDTAAVPAAPDTEPLAKPGKPERRGWVLPVAIVGGVVLLALLLFGAFFIIRRSRIIAARVGGGTGGDTGGEVVSPPGDGDGLPQPPSGKLSCEPGHKAVAKGLPFDALPPEAQKVDDGVLVKAKGDQGVPIAIPGPEAPDSNLTLEMVMPEGEAILALISRVSPGYEYYALYDGSGRAWLVRNGEHVAENPDAPPIADGEPHVLSLHNYAGVTWFLVDGMILFEYADPQPLPPGKFGLEVSKGTVLLRELVLCLPEGAAPGGEPGGPDQPGAPVGPSSDMPAPAFADDFSADTPLPAWEWMSGPREAMHLTEGMAVVEVVPESRLVSLGGAGVDAPMAAVSLDNVGIPRDGDFTAEVRLQFTPRQDFQGAGLIAITRSKLPILTLLRAYCRSLPYCQDDAIYFDNWVVFARARADYQSPVNAEALMPDEFVILRLVKEGDILRAYYSPTQGKWFPVGEWPLERAQLGYLGLLTTGGGQPVEPIPAFFDDFALYSGAWPPIP